MILIPTRIVRVNIITMTFVQPTIRKNKGRQPHQTEKDPYKQQHNNSGTEGGDNTHPTRITSLHQTQLNILVRVSLVLQLMGQLGIQPLLLLFKTLST